MWAKARSDIRSQHLDTVLGQIWTVLNPLLLGLVYALLISIFVGRDLELTTLATVLAGLFPFYYTRGIVAGAGSIIVRSGAAILNSSFPRITLPLSNLMLATIVYLPSLAVYAFFHVAARFPIGASLVWIPVIIVLHGLTSFGIGLLFSAATVFFRDTASFLPYLLRIWMYLTPVLFRIDDIPDQFRGVIAANPLTPLFVVWGQVVLDGEMPSMSYVGQSAGWAIVAMGLGTWVFISKEREFAVRI